MTTPSDESREILLETACSLSNNACRLFQQDDGNYSDAFMLFNECLLLVESSLKQRQAGVQSHTIRNTKHLHDIFTEMKDFFHLMYFPEKYSVMKDDTHLQQEEQITMVILYNMSLLLQKGRQFENSLSTLHMISSLLDENESNAKCHPNFQLAILYHIAEVTYHQNTEDNLDTALNGFIEALHFLVQQQQQNKVDLGHETSTADSQRISPIMSASLWSRTSGILLEAGYFAQANEALQNAIQCHDTAALDLLAESQHNMACQKSNGTSANGYSFVLSAESAAAPAA